MNTRPKAASPHSKTPRVVLHVGVSRELVQQIDALAKIENRNRNNMVRNLIERGMGKGK